MKSKKRLVFWQNIVSPHQSYFFDQISLDFDVILVVENLMSEVRKEQGWSIPEIENIQIIKIEDTETLNLLINEFKHDKNIFSGLLGSGYPFLKKAFVEIIKYNKVYVICEAPILLGFSKYLRILKYKFLYFKCKNDIAHIFAMGKLGEEFYSNIGFNKKNITAFQYFIKPDSEEIKYDLVRSKKKYVFVGQLIHRKGIDNLIEAFSKIDKSFNWELLIIGNGNLSNDIKTLIINQKLQEKVFILGNKDNSEVKQIISNSDFLVLPSRFDGWGAVVSEALSVGTKVISSDMCGSAVLINEFNGYVYKEKKSNELVNIITLSLNDEDYDRNRIKNTFNKQSRMIIDKFIYILNKEI